MYSNKNVINFYVHNNIILYIKCVLDLQVIYSVINWKSLNLIVFYSFSLLSISFSFSKKSYKITIIRITINVQEFLDIQQYKD